jgi:hypothetical protein
MTSRLESAYSYESQTTIPGVGEWTLHLIQLSGKQISPFSSADGLLDRYADKSGSPYENVRHASEYKSAPSEMMQTSGYNLAYFFVHSQRFCAKVNDNHNRNRNAKQIAENTPTLVLVGPLRKQ